MTDNSEKLIKSEIKGRKVTYYLTTEDDLHNVKSNSLLGDIFSVLASLTAGGIISVILTRATGIQLGQETTNVLGILLYVFICGLVIFALFTAYFHYQSFTTIKKIKGSGAVKSLRSADQEEAIETAKTEKEITPKESRLEIIKAEYWTQKAKLDVTEELRKKIVDNKLETIASNDIKGDPDKKTVKKLTIEYKFDGITITKEFREGQKVVIP
jgi:glycerol-3-phosphate cytidylyltransferase-like family protein